MLYFIQHPSEFSAPLKDASVMMLGSFHALPVASSQLWNTSFCWCLNQQSIHFWLWCQSDAPAGSAYAPSLVSHRQSPLPLCFPQGLMRLPSAKLWPLPMLRTSSTVLPATSWKSNFRPRRYYGNSHHQLWDCRLIWGPSSVTALQIAY